MAGRVLVFITILAFQLIWDINAQTDTVFWFVAPEVSQANQDFDKPILLRISALSQAAFVTISQPANPAFTVQFVSVPANGAVTVDLTSQISLIENQPANAILNYGLLIRSTSLITVYYEVMSSSCRCNPEIFSLKGRNALGTEFYIPAQDFWRNSISYSPWPYSSFEIVATEDSTFVSITPKKDIIGHTANTTFSLPLNKGQTYSATAASQLAADHLGGSKVTSNKPIAVTVKDDLMEHLPFGICRDLAGDQIVPTNVIGKKYIAVKGFLNFPDKIFIIASMDSTEVYVGGGATPVAVIHEGDIYEFDLASGAIYVETSKPAYLLHITGFGCETGQEVLPPIECTGSRQVSFTRSTNENFGLIIIVKYGSEDDFFLNGSNALIPQSSFTPVPGTNGQWLTANLIFNPIDIPVNTASLITNSSGLFHVGIINGGNITGSRYGFLSNYNSIQSSITPDTIICHGSSIQLSAS